MLLPTPPPSRSLRRLARQDRQRFGSPKPREAKNSWSSAVKVNCCPQSTHVRVLSTKGTETPPIKVVVRLRAHVWRGFGSQICIGQHSSARRSVKISEQGCRRPENLSALEEKAPVAGCCFLQDLSS